MTVNHRQVEREAALWLARRDAGGWTASQQAQLDAWLATDTAHRVAFLRLDAAWEEAARLKTLAVRTGRDAVPGRGEWAQSPYFVDVVDSVAATAAPRPRRRAHATSQRRWHWLAGVAASFLLVAAIAGGLAWRDSTRVARASWSTAAGAQRVVHLSDGSVATLGGATELDTAFSRRARDLELVHGEAFFDVQHDPSRPFTVHAGGYRVIAVGTRFDVRHDGPDRLRVVVTRGLVRLQSASHPGQPPAMLPVGSIALVNGDEVAIQRVTLGEARERLSWRDGHAVFHGTPLAEAVREFNRYNARTIVIADPSLDELRVGGNFRLDNSEAFVRLLQQVFPVRAERQGDRIVLSRRAEARPGH